MIHTIWYRVISFYVVTQLGKVKVCPRYTIPQIPGVGCQHPKFF